MDTVLWPLFKDNLAQLLPEIQGLLLQLENNSIIKARCSIQKGLPRRKVEVGRNTINTTNHHKQQPKAPHTINHQPQMGYTLTILQEKNNKFQKART